VVARAKDFGKTGYETKAELDADTAMLARMEAVRLKASVLMGMGDATGKVVPKFCLIAPPRDGGAITSRYFVPQNCHATHAVTGGLCLAATCVVPGTVAEGVAVLPPGPRRTIIIEHPSGKLGTEFEFHGTAEKPDIRRAAFIRTARRLFEGSILVPQSVWSGKQAARAAAE
jgi:4-oxalomesaconate tautomerase